MLLQMQHAEERGDRRSARDLARQILATRRESPLPVEPAVEAGRTSDGEQAAARTSATELLARTEPDAFLLVVGLVGLGVMVWLVYNYVL
jgi:hypothetical protein